MKNDTLTSADLARIRAFYQRSSADILTAIDGPGTGIIWTIPPNSPDALRRAVRQLRRAKTTRVQWIRRLRLSSRSQGMIEVFGIYVVPDRSQRIYSLETGTEVLCGPLTDICMEVVVQEMTV